MAEKERATVSQLVGNLLPTYERMASDIKHKDILKIWLNDSQIIMEKMKRRNEQKVKLPLKE